MRLVNKLPRTKTSKKCIHMAIIYLDHGGSAGLSLGGSDGVSHGMQIIDVGHSLHVPSVRIIALVHV